MDLAEHRRARGLSQEQAAAELGLKSKGYLSSLESRRFPCPLKLALQIERWSDGEVTAASLVSADDADLLKGALSRATDESLEAQP